MARLTRRSFTVGAVALSAAACGTRMQSPPASPAIVVDRPSALVDVPIKIALKGFPAGQPVTITATLEFADTSQWQSRATFITDAGGHVDLTREAPISGTYEGVAAMGLIWSAERLPGEWLPIPPGSVMQPWFVHLDATASDGTRAQTRINRTVAGGSDAAHRARSRHRRRTVPASRRRAPSGCHGRVRGWRRHPGAPRGHPCLPRLCRAGPGLLRRRRPPAGPRQYPARVLRERDSLDALSAMAGQWFPSKTG